jgi:hypothetical protein
MQDGLAGRNTFVGVESHQALKQVDLKFVKCWAVVFHRNSPPFWKRWFKLRQIVRIRPVILSGRAEDFENFEDLVDLTITREQRPSLCHLSEDAASTPEINSQTVSLLTQQNLGAAVPERHHLMSVGLDGQTKSPG